MASDLITLTTSHLGHRWWFTIETSTDIYHRRLPNYILISAKKSRKKWWRNKNNGRKSKKNEDEEEIYYKAILTAYQVVWIYDYMSFIHLHKADLCIYKFYSGQNIQHKIRQLWILLKYLSKTTLSYSVI